MKPIEDRYAKAAAEGLELLGCQGLIAMLTTAPATADPEELALRKACWEAVLRQCPAAAA
jgi:hypothetical protein